VIERDRIQRSVQVQDLHGEGSLDGDASPIRPTHILDDDPTGTQSVQDAPVGLGAETAWVEGPAMTGVATWRIGEGSRAVRLLIVPGNVGSDALIAEVVSQVVAPGSDTES